MRRNDSEWGKFPTVHFYTLRNPTDRLWKTLGAGARQLRCNVGGLNYMWIEEAPHVEGRQSGDKAAPDVVEVSGKIKWFDPSKGYGFMVPDEDLSEVFLHGTCLRGAGFQTAYEGARVVCEAIRTSRGLKALRILTMDNSTAVLPWQLPQRTHVVVVSESDWERAVVKWFNRLRGFGFLTRGPQTPDIFIHAETLRRFGFAELRPGQSVLVRYGRGSNGLMAAELKPDNAGGPAAH